LEAKRKEAMARGGKPKYDRTCREKNLPKAPGSVVRLKAPETGSTCFQDRIKGAIAFSNEELDDLILERSDGSPTYHLAVVVDDLELGITHVIRGDDHVNNTPRQILIYQALGEPLPVYAHVPMILGADRTRLSKRHGATSILAYQEMGCLPEALVNYLARLGWSYGDQEIFSREELVDKFSLDQVGRSAGIFNQEKLLWLNAHYLKESSPLRLAPLLHPFLKEKGVETGDLSYVARAAATLQPRSKTLAEMAEAALFYFQEQLVFDPKSAGKFLTPATLPILEDVRAILEGLLDFSPETLEQSFHSFSEEKGISLKDLAQPVRMALTGRTYSPGLFEVMDILGQETVLKRLEAAMEWIKNLY
jgi:glutamyl-tRNA synthetase